MDSDLSDIESKEVDLEDQPELRNERRLLSWILSKSVPLVPLPNEREPYPAFRVNILSQIMFTWLFPLMNKGYKRTLVPEDLFVVDGELSSKSLTESFNSSLKRRVEKKNDSTEKTTTKPLKISRYSLILSSLSVCWWKLLLSVILYSLGNVIVSTTPLVSKAMIDFVDRRSQGLNVNVGKGVGLAIAFFLMTALDSMLTQHSMHLAVMAGAEIRSVLTHVILEKALKLDSKGRHDFPAGTITSLMSTDVSRIDFAIGFMSMFVAFPIAFVITIALLLRNIGVSALSGIGVCTAAVLALFAFTGKMFELRESTAVFTDKRVSLILEALNSMKIIKFYAWEGAYGKRISDVRKKESNKVLQMTILKNILTSVTYGIPSISTMVAFCVMYALNRDRNPADIFSSVSLFGVLSSTFMFIPDGMSLMIDAFSGFDRITKFLDAGEEKNESTGRVIEPGPDFNRSLAIKVSDASFKWLSFAEEKSDDSSEVNKLTPIEAGEIETAELDSTREKQQPTDDSLVQPSGDLIISSPSTSSGFQNVNFEIKKNELVIITGSIGSGKSSLLQALAGTMPQSEGTVQLDGSLLYCGEPWVQNATVKENIIFGSPWDAKRYKDVIHSCALQPDLDILPAGDHTEIGEKGITLSGGQKARLNLARAVYNNPEIILLDDVLSAVDARVGKHIMDNCITGLLKNSTRILATHQLSLIGTADRIIFLEGDGTIKIDSRENLFAQCSSFRNLMKFDSSVTESSESQNKTDDGLLKRENNEQDIQVDLKGRDGNGKLIIDEEKAVNHTPFAVYKAYFGLGFGKLGVFGFILFILLVAIAAFCQVFTNTWLSFWTENRFPGRSGIFYIGIYIMLIFTNLILLVIEFTVLAYIGIIASKELNILASLNIFHTPMSYLDTTPIGRIINRFTKDTNSLDNEIIELLQQLILGISYVVGIIILCIVYIPWFAIVVPLLGVLYVCLFSYYQGASREVKRLEAVQRSFVYNNFNECLSGLSTIKAYQREKYFIEKNDYLIDKTNESNFITNANQRWLGINVSLVTSICILLLSLLCVTGQFNIGASSTGLLLSYIVEVVGMLSFVLRILTRVENDMNSAERIYHYAYNLPQEAAYKIPERTPSPEWPENGEITFTDVSMSYRPGLPFVLNNLSMNVGSGERIGICGRTGAGKSSIMVALYRLSELAEGKIEIDGVDISRLGLYDLRSKLSIIPQDPVIFKGTIRDNLDPFNQYSDEALWRALQRGGLIEETQWAAVKSSNVKNDGLENLHKFHLEQKVEENGENLSLGEKQLVALARALVRDTKILILDEATSSVDYETDSKVQRTINTEFAHCTILCIAHRLKTIVNYDRILVLDKGGLKEFDTPWNLFNNGGIFRQMCDKSSILAEDFKQTDEAREIL